ncbi:MAG: energy transducer TonB family protein, partial [Sphingomonas sp.]
MLEIATLLAALVAPQPPMAVPPPPAPGMQKHFTRFVPSIATCDGIPVPPRETEAAMSSVGYAYSSEKPQPYTLTFRIDSDGRPLDIRADGADDPRWIDTSDVMPAFSVWRFAAGQPHQHCSITFAVDDQPIETAPAEAVMRYFSLPHSEQGFYQDVLKRTEPANSTCFEPNYPPAMQLNYPNFETIPQRPGTRSFVMLGFDVDAQGRTTNVHVVSSDGNQALDAKSLAAMKQDRFVPEARRGCTYPFRRTANAPVPAPPMPDVDALKSADAKCDGKDGDWVDTPGLTFPEAYRRRSIEGWAIIPVLVVAAICLPWVRRTVTFAAGVAAGFLVPVVPF